MTPRPTPHDWGQWLDGIAAERDRESAAVRGDCYSHWLSGEGPQQAGRAQQNALRRRRAEQPHHALAPTNPSCHTGGSYAVSSASQSSLVGHH